MADAREKISASQRARYEHERQERARLRNDLHAFALWLHPTWDDENDDDVAAALQAVDEFLEVGPEVGKPPEQAATDTARGS